MKLLVLLASFSFVTCNQGVPAQRSAAHHSNKTSKGVLVSADWIGRYKTAEAKYSYSIPEDSQIKAEGNKFRVPKSVVDHYADMTKATTNP